MKLLLLGNPENRRVSSFQDAWTEAAGQAADVLGWHSVIRSPGLLARHLEGADMLRIDSPGENAEVARQILARGAAGAPASSPTALEPDRIRQQRQWFRGWSRVLEDIDTPIRRAGVHSTADPGTIRTLFDKSRCHEVCRRHGLPTPELVATSPAGFDDLMATMEQAGCHRVFLKPRHGSSASGVVALRKRGGEVIGTAAIEGQGNAFYNSLRVRDFRIATGLREMVDCVCRQDAIVERWFPKCGFEGATVDLRMVTIGGEPTHWILRSSPGPLTNLHLGNRRGNVEAFRETMGSHWEEALAVCRRAAAAFPGMLTLGIDLLVSPSHQRFAIAEINAFGDLLPGIIDAHGRSTYQRQAAEMLHGDR